MTAARRAEISLYHQADQDGEEVVDLGGGAELLELAGEVEGEVGVVGEDGGAEAVARAASNGGVAL
jgi:predicted RNA methylase